MNPTKMFMPRLTRILLLVLGIVIFMASCTERKTNDPIETYKYWAGEAPPKEVTVIHGKYWQSSHWSKEYIVYLELTASPGWRDQFVKQNKMIETKMDFGPPTDAPDWFKPGKGLRVLVPEGASQGSVYYEDTVAGRMFIYEIQL